MNGSSASGRWIQGLLLAGVFAATFFCLRSLAEVVPAQLRIHDELGGKPLPPVTQWLFEYRTIFVFVSVFIPLAALATFAWPDRTEACCVLVLLALLAIFEAFVVYAALRLPFVQLTKQMGSGGG